MSNSARPEVEQARPRHGLLQAFGLLVSLSVCLGAGGLGAWATNPEIPGWYAGIAKPDWNPPNWIFGPVWTTLYLMMAVAAWLVWRRSTWSVCRTALGAFGIQLALNSTWSFLFFHYHRPDWAAIEIVLLWVAILVTIVLFWRHSVTGALLMLPYLCWVSFATVLNFTIWQLNPAV